MKKTSLLIIFFLIGNIANAEDFTFRVPVKLTNVQATHFQVTCTLLDINLNIVQPGTSSNWKSIPNGGNLNTTVIIRKSTDRRERVKNFKCFVTLKLSATKKAYGYASNFLQQYNQEFSPYATNGVGVVVGVIN